jgi:hypothetical protein
MSVACFQTIDYRIARRWWVNPFLRSVQPCRSIRSGRS